MSGFIDPVMEDLESIGYSANTLVFCIEALPLSPGICITGTSLYKSNTKFVPTCNIVKIEISETWDWY